jgi:CDP-diacylglycerol--serine O-phosphatidyltransferase
VWCVENSPEKLKAHRLKPVPHGRDMTEAEQHAMPFIEKPTRRARLRRGIFLLPSLFTVANLLCGYYASIAALVGGREDFDHAAKALGIAILFDSLDGRIARMTGTNTEFGVQLDSLADVVSFGIAPAILAYAWGFRYAFGTNGEFHQLGEFAWLCCLAFLICSAWRLARFNVKGMEPGGNKNFVGMPTPAAAGVVAAVVHSRHYSAPINDKNWAIAWFVLLVVLGGLMTSTVRYYSFKDIPWTRKQPSIAIILLCLLVAIVWKYSEEALVIIAGTYAVAGLILHIVRFLRHRLLTRTA